MAREGEDGQYVLISNEAKLMIDATHGTIALHDQGAAGTRVLLHVSVHSNLFGSLERKLMLCPASRGPAWIFEFSLAAEALTAIASLRAFGVKVRSPRALDDLSIPSAEELEEKIEHLAGSASFGAYLGALESALARRQRLGLADILQ